MQPDVYCRRLGLHVPVAVSVKTGQTADVFHAICNIAMNPYVVQFQDGDITLIASIIGILQYQAVQTVQ